MGAGGAEELGSGGAGGAVGWELGSRGEQGR